MTTFAPRLALVSSLLLGAALSACTIESDPYPPAVPVSGGYTSQVVVEAPPPPPPPPPEVVVVQPSPAHVWVGGYWGWGGSRYDWHPGRWERRPSAALTGTTRTGSVAVAVTSGSMDAGADDDRGLAVRPQGERPSTGGRGAMTLADFLLEQTPSIVGLFTRRLQVTLAPGVSRGELVNHVPELLHDVARALRQGDEPSLRLLSTAPDVHEHGRRRFGIGYDLGTLVREFRLLRDCIFERLEDTGEQPTLREHRTLDICLSDLLVGSVDEFLHERDALLARETLARAEAEAGRQQAEEASRIKNEFLATVSHELRTPLTSMLGWVQMLRAGSLASDRREHALAVIDRNARAQAQLIDDLLDMSRILAGKLRLEVEPLDVQAVVLAAIETIRPTADTKGIRIQPTLSSCGLVMGDPHRLQQVVWNLLSNAVKFTPKNGRIQVTVECPHSSVEISVADTGKGISPDFLPHVFDRFRQADGGMSRRFGGLGLGLSIVRQLVELHGGTVNAASEGEGLGARFTVRLPISVATRELDAPPSFQRSLRSHGVQCPPELTGLRLLIVDDEQDTRELLQVMLEGCGAVVRVAASAAEALALCIQEHPDVLVSDIGMPEENGYRLIEKIRALPFEQGGEVPAIALTAYARTEDRTRALLAGFSNHVAKPVEPLELLAVIASLARRVRS